MNNEIIWFLLLNDMRSGHIEDLQPVAFASTRETLEELIRRETVPAYQTEDWKVWFKTFRQGGPLEWFNRPMEGGFFDHWHFVQASRYVDRCEGLIDTSLYNG